MYRCPFPGKYVEKIVTKVMTPPNFPIRYSDLKAKIQYHDGCPNQLEIGSVIVVPIRLSHPNGACGYKFIEDDKKFVFLTDNELGLIHPGGLAFDDYLDFSSGADLLFHDAEYTPEEYETKKEWGHSSYADAIDLVAKAGVKKLGLFHLNQERTDPDMDKIVETCRQIIIDKGYNFECFAVGSDITFKL